MKIQLQRHDELEVFASDTIITEEISIADAMRAVASNPWGASDEVSQEVVPGHGPQAVDAVYIHGIQDLRELEKLGYHLVDPVTLAKFIKAHSPPRAGHSQHSYEIGTVWNGKSFRYFWFKDGSRFDVYDESAVPEIVVVTKG